MMMFGEKLSCQKSMVVISLPHALTTVGPLTLEVLRVRYVFVRGQEEYDVALFVLYRDDVEKAVERSS